MEKVNLPTKTKIAAWMIILIGGILGPFLGISLFKMAGNEAWSLFAVLLGWPTSVGTSLFYFIPGLFLFFKRKKWAYWVSLFSTPLAGFSGTWVTGAFFGSDFPPGSGSLAMATSIVYFLAIFILLLLDRKNFYKVAS